MFNAIILLLQQSKSQPSLTDELPVPIQHFLEFIDTPAPFSPFSEYLAILFLLWLLARLSRERKPDFGAQAQKVLDEKYRSGELDREQYEKYRQELSMKFKS